MRVGYRIGPGRPCGVPQCVDTADIDRFYSASKKSAALASFRCVGGEVRSFHSMTTCTRRGGDEQINDGLMFCSSGEGWGLMNAGR